MPEKQNLIRICETRDVRRQNFSKLGASYVRNDRAMEAWYTPRSFLQRIEKFGGTYWLPVDERYAMPISPYADRYFHSEDEIKDLTDQDKVADMSCDLTRLENDITHKKTKFYDFMSIAVMGMVVAFVIIALLAASGRIDIGAVFRGAGG